MTSINALENSQLFSFRFVKPEIPQFSFVNFKFNPIFHFCCAGLKHIY